MFDALLQLGLGVDDVLNVLAVGAGGQVRAVVVVLAADPAPEPCVLAARDQEIAPCWPRIG
eukprot:4555483-Lingulodinium_polyedra.AAC.1